jgi:hypothetical protein
MGTTFGCCRNLCGPGSCLSRAEGAAAAFDIVRGLSLETFMSRYLIERIAALPNVVLHFRTEVEALVDDAVNALQGLKQRNHDTGTAATKAIRHLFIFVGADPNTAWLSECLIALDTHGFVRTREATIDGRGRLLVACRYRWRRACRMFTRSATSARAEPRRGPQLLGSARRWWPPCTVSWQLPRGRHIVNIARASSL